MALLFTSNDEIGKDRDYRAVHRHGDGHFIEWNLIKKDLHVLNAVNRNACFADVAFYAFMIAVVATVGGKVERH